VSPGVAEVSAFSHVVTTADAHSAVPPLFTRADSIAMAVSRSIAEAGTGWPGTGADGSPVA
jgi:hypothetical protein